MKIYVHCAAVYRPTIAVFPFDPIYVKITASGEEVGVLRNIMAPLTQRRARLQLRMTPLELRRARRVMSSAPI